MSGAGAAGRLERIPTGVKDLDQLIDGGYPRGRTILVTGGPGVGKTILALQYIDAACRDGLDCLYLATEETPDELKAQAAQLGIPTGDYEERGLLTIMPALEERLDDAQWQRGKGSANAFFKKPLAAIKASDAKVLVLDNIGSYTIDTTIGTFREQMDLLVHAIRGRSMTGLIVCDETLNDRYNNVAQHSVHGAIHMFKRENPFTGNVERLMNVVKMRGTSTPMGYVRYTIGGKGIIIQAQK